MREEKCLKVILTTK